MSDEGLLSVLEAILITADRPLNAQELGKSLDVPAYMVTEALEQLRDEYAGEGGGRPRGFVVRNVGGGWRLYSHPQWAKEVGDFISGSEQSQLSQAALETLAIVAYRQPVSRAQMAGIRGVNVDSVVRSLVSRGLIEEVDVTPTGANLYGTTDEFLALMGMSSLDELIPLAPLLPDAASIDSLTIEVEEPE